jgi:hypothetical protein
METVTIKKDNLLKAFNDASDSEKAYLKRLFPTDLILEKREEDVKTFEDACETEGIDPTDRKFTQGDPDDIAYQKLKVIKRAINPKGWTADWNNSNQRKWSPWFYMDKPGFRFYVAYYDITFTITSCGSRLCFSSEELATYAANQFLDIYKDLLD